MLMHHSDSVRDCVMRILNNSRFAVNPYFAAVSVVKAVSDTHDRRFAGTILTDDRVDRPFSDSQRHVIIRNDASESLSNIL